MRRAVDVLLENDFLRNRGNKDHAFWYTGLPFLPFPGHAALLASSPPVPQAAASTGQLCLLHELAAGLGLDSGGPDCRKLSVRDPFSRCGKGTSVSFFAFFMFQSEYPVFYKYIGFILENFQGFSGKSFGLTGFDPMMQILAPIGISFITFGFIHYGIEVYRGHSPVCNWTDFAIYSAFFPTLICGPIKRYDDFIPQLISRPVFQEDRFIRSLWLLTRGMFKKIVLADNLNDICAAGFAHIAGLGVIDAWIVVIAFTFQIYFDFSGYTDMARGSAGIMGYQLPENFRLPYLAENIAAFWRRWHLLTTFTGRTLKVSPRRRGQKLLMF